MQKRDARRSRLLTGHRKDRAARLRRTLNRIVNRRKLRLREERGDTQTRNEKGNRKSNHSGTRLTETGREAKDASSVSHLFDRFSRPTLVSGQVPRSESKPACGNLAAFHRGSLASSDASFARFGPPIAAKSRNRRLPTPILTNDLTNKAGAVQMLLEGHSAASKSCQTESCKTVGEVLRTVE